MAKLWRWAAGLALVLAGNAACGEAAPSEMENVFTTRVEYPTLEGEALNRRLAEWLGDRVKEYVMAGAESLYDDSVEPNRQYEIETYLKASAFHPSKNIVSLLLSQSLYGIGVHGWNSKEARVFRIDDGAELTLKDLFQQPELALEIMANQAREGVADYLRRIEEEAPTDLDDWLRAGIAPGPDNYRTLVPLPDGIQVWFQDYQVLPYAFGAPNFIVPLRDLEPACPNPAVWPTAK